MKHRGQITHQQYRGGGPRDFGPGRAVERPPMLLVGTDFDEELACYCTGLRHRHEPPYCPTDRIEDDQ